MAKLIVDLSEFKAGIDFARMKLEGVEGVIIRGGDGTYLDKEFETFYNKAKLRGLPVGVFWYSRAVNVAQAQAEAERLYTHCLKGRSFDLPIYLDVECNAQGSLGRDRLTAVILAWAKYLQERGYLCGLYTWPSWVRDKMHREQLTGLELWLCQWSADKPAMECGMWQFGGEDNFIRHRTIAGQVVDQNYMYKDYPAIIKKQGKNGYKKEGKTMYKFFEDVPSWAQEAVKAAMDKGAVKGTGKEGGKIVLNLSEDVVRVIAILHNLKLV